MYGHCSPSECRTSKRTKKRKHKVLDVIHVYIAECWLDNLKNLLNTVIRRTNSKLPRHFCIKVKWPRV
jgi:hypothetical protein